MRRFEVTVTMVVMVEISDDVIALHTDKRFVDDFYGLDTPEKIAQHLAWNVGIQRSRLSDLDGFADRANAEVDADVTDVEYDTREVT